VLEFRKMEPTCRVGLAWLGLAWLGLAWLGLAWLGISVFANTLLINCQ